MNPTKSKFIAMKLFKRISIGLANIPLVNVRIFAYICNICINEKLAKEKIQINNNHYMNDFNNNWNNDEFTLISNNQ